MAAQDCEARRGMVIEHPEGFVGAVVGVEGGAVRLQDRRGRERLFPLPARFLLEGRPVTLRAPTAVRRPVAPARTASGSRAVAGHRARTARASRILVEGVHDAALVERVWGDDLRVEGVVVERLDGLDHLDAALRSFAPGPQRRLGVLVDHLVPGSKEARIVASVGSPHVLVTGTPFVDVWMAVRPQVLGLPAWPVVPKGRPWKEGICEAVGEPDPAVVWRRILASVRSYRDLDPALVGAVEQLIDFVTA